MPRLDFLLCICCFCNGFFVVYLHCIVDMLKPNDIPTWRKLYVWVLLVFAMAFILYISTVSCICKSDDVPD